MATSTESVEVELEWVAMASKQKITQVDVPAKAGDRIEISVTPIAFDATVWCYCLNSGQRHKALPWQPGGLAPSEGVTEGVWPLTFYKQSDFFLVPSEDTWLVVVRTMPDQRVSIKHHPQEDAV